jgi:hypothetical protein
MFLTKLKLSASTMLAVGAASLLVTAAVGFTQQESKAKASSPLVSGQTKVILAKLEEPIPMSFANATPLDDVLKYIHSATKGPNRPGIPIYVDPLGLQQAGCTLTSAVTINVENIPLKETLSQVLAQLRLKYLVKDGVLFISSPRGIDRERNELVVLAKDESTKTKAVLARLDEPISMSFANDTPLQDVLKYIKAATTGPNRPGIPIYVVPAGLQEADRSMKSTIRIDLEGVPLKTTLRLLLKQLGLAYVVKDGSVLINSPHGIRNLKG